MKCTAEWIQSADPRTDHQKVFVSSNGGAFADKSGSLGMTSTKFEFDVVEGEAIQCYVYSYDTDESSLSSKSATVTATAHDLTPLLPATGLTLRFN